MPHGAGGGNNNVLLWNRRMTELPARTKRSAWLRALPLLVLLLGAAAFFALGLQRYASLEALRDNREALALWVARQGWVASAAFLGGYALATALSLPVGALATLAGGFLFGTVHGALLAAIGATLGGTVVFLAARTVLADTLRARAGGAVARMAEGFRRSAFSYLLFLRLVPAFPFWLTNLVPALLGVRLRVFVAATAIGILPGTLAYAAAGSGLGAVLDQGGTPDLGLIFTPPILLPLLGLAVLALAPVLYRRWKARRP